MLSSVQAANALAVATIDITTCAGFTPLHGACPAGRGQALGAARLTVGMSISDCLESLQVFVVSFCQIGLVHEILR